MSTSRTTRTFATRAVLAVAVVTAFSLALRWNAVSFAGWLNIDEGEILAAGRRAAMEPWLPMATASANTYFPLWPTSLGFLDVLGVPMTLRAAHVLSALSYAAIFSMVWVATARRWGWIGPAVFILPGAYWILTVHTDFMELGTELPSVLVLVLGAVVAFPPDRAVSARRLAVVTAIASLAPWFKPQSGPLALALVLSACGFAYLRREEPWSGKEWVRRAAWLGAGGLAPSVFLLAVMAVGGTWDLFWDEPVGFVRAYLSHDVGNLGVGDKSAPLPERLDQLGHDVRSNWLALVWTLVGLRGCWLGRRGSVGRFGACVVVWATPIVAALATLLVQWPVWTHYLNFLFGGAAIAAIAGSGLAGAPDATRSTPGLLPVVRGRVAEVAGLVAVVVAVAAAVAASALPRPVPAFDPPLHSGERALSELCPPGTSVFVWGWAAELYAYYDWQPASRYVTWSLLRATTPHQEQYRRSFLDEMSADPPSCVVNAVGPAWFGWSTPEMQLENDIPQTREWLDACYTPTTVTFAPEDAISVWTRNAGC